MPEPNGDRVQLRAYYDPETGRHKLEVNPEVLRVCKRKTRVVSMTVTNETVETDQYKAVTLGYRIEGGKLKSASRNPKDVFDDCPNLPGSSFMVPDDGKPCYLTIKQHLGLEPRPEPCSFSDDKPGPHVMIIRFTHEGWDDAAGSGEHAWWHTES